jgi:hypothetical protein
VAEDELGVGLVASTSNSKVALPMVESILKGVRDAAGLEGKLNAEILDQGEKLVPGTATKF